MKKHCLQRILLLIFVLFLLASCSNGKPSNDQDKKPVEEAGTSYRVSDLLGDPVSIRIVETDYGTDYDRTFTGEDLADLLAQLENAVVMKDIEPVKGAGGMGLYLTITYKDGTITEAVDGNYCFTLGDTVYPYPLESLENHKTILEQLILIDENAKP